jgi:hypothetical protein
VDAADAAPACQKAANGDACTAGTGCCSNACGEGRKCTASCKLEAAGCSLDSNECCLGTFCSFNAAGKCVTCIAAGAKAEVYAVVARAVSCCSGSVNFVNGNCN